MCVAIHANYILNPAQWTKVTMTYVGSSAVFNQKITRNNSFRSSRVIKRQTGCRLISSDRASSSSSCISCLRRCKYFGSFPYVGWNTKVVCKPELFKSWESPLRVSTYLALGCRGFAWTTYRIFSNLKFLAGALWQRDGSRFGIGGIRRRKQSWSLGAGEGRMPAPIFKKFSGGSNGTSA